MSLVRQSFTAVLFSVMLVVFLAHLSMNAFGGEQTADKKVTISEFLAAAQDNNVITLSRGLSQHIPIDTKDSKGRTALLIATYANALDAARLLIGAGADVNAKDVLNDSPYLYAGAEGRLGILKMTVAAGADLKSVNRYGGTALTPAAHHGHLEVVQYLLTTDIDIDQVNHLGWTALLEAVILGDGGARHIEIVRALVKAGADKSIADRDGVTPLQAVTVILPMSDAQFECRDFGRSLKRGRIIFSLSHKSLRNKRRAYDTYYGTMPIGQIEVTNMPIAFCDHRLRGFFLCL